MTTTDGDLEARQLTIGLLKNPTPLVLVMLREIKADILLINLPDPPDLPLAPIEIAWKIANAIQRPQRIETEILLDVRKRIIRGAENEEDFEDIYDVLLGEDDQGRWYWRWDSDNAPHGCDWHGPFVSAARALHDELAYPDSEVRSVTTTDTSPALCDMCGVEGETLDSGLCGTCATEMAADKDDQDRRARDQSDGCACTMASCGYCGRCCHGRCV